MKIIERNIVFPPKNGSDFKELFKYATEIGVGLPIGGDGLPIGTWTPQSLAAALSEIETNKAGADLRAVQHWFEDNDKGISAPSINLLARVFGADDTEATTAWRSELTAGQRRLMAKRKATRQPSNRRKPVSVLNSVTEKSDGSQDSDEKRAVAPHPANTYRRSRLATGVSAMLTGNNSIYLLIMVWAAWSVLALVAAILGVGDITYKAAEGINKQVGFYHSPTWTIEKIVLVPIYLIVTSKAVIAWLQYRDSFASIPGFSAWEYRVSTFRMAFYAVLIVSIVVIFGLQWYGNYLQPILDGPNAVVAPNWIRVTTNPIELAPERLVVGISLFAGLYIGTIYWLCFSSLLLLYIAAHDLSEIHEKDKSHDNTSRYGESRAAAQALIIALYRSVICGVLMSMVIKVSVLYLDTDAPNITTWFTRDILSGFGYAEQSWNWLGDRQLAAQTSFMFLFTITSVAYLGIYRVKLAVEAAKQPLLVSHLSLTAVPTAMIMTFGLVGVFQGFSLLVLLSLIVGAWQLITPSLRFHPTTTQLPPSTSPRR
ncbi:hypothetical protein [Ruegeria hyattellae]|uniref:hypothetical protein n=1 Tax=Ruegeria hyattellae TaxID=3233337 RepID=UPI00355C68B9